MNNYDLIIIGGGAAGLSAATYAGRSMLNTLIIEKFSYGGRINDTLKIINYPGFIETTGRELASEFRQQAENFSTNEFVHGTVTSIEKIDDEFIIKTKRRREYKAKAVIIATGTSSRVLGVPGENEFTGRGVSYCSTCDADYFKDKDIHVLGSGDVALEEADYLSRFVNSINMIIMHDEGEFDGNALEVEKIKNNPKVSYTWNSKLSKIFGDDKVSGIEVHNEKLDRNFTLTSDGIFIFAGMSPNSDFLEDLVDVDEFGFIETDDKMETKTAGLFAAGDIRDKSLRQIVTATNDGAIASVYAERYIRSRGER